MTEIIRPQDEQELAAAVADAAASDTPLEIIGAGTKREVGRPLQTAALLSTKRLTGITLYEPSELVLSARAGTPLKEVEATLAKNNQQLAFEPIDLGPALGQRPDRATIGAVFAANLSGARRVLVGAARDHFLGMRAVNGRGEAFKSGGRVMKNVTGYDLCRGLAGSWGTLAVMSEVTMKVLPKAEEARSIVICGLTDAAAVEAMCAAMGTPYEVSGAAHVQASLAPGLRDQELAERGEAATVLRLENFSASLGYRAKRLAEAVRMYGALIELDDKRSQAFWDDMRCLKPLRGDGALWRLSVAPRLGARLVAAISRNLECRALYDWSGGLIWLEAPALTDAGATEMRAAIADIGGGHATLIRAEPGIRAAVEVFQPLPPAVAALTQGVKAAFDPKGVLNPGRMYPGI